MESELRTTFEAGDAAANDRAIAALVRRCTTAKALTSLFALEVLQDASVGSEDGHGAETTDAVLELVGRPRRRREAAVLAATLAAPTLLSLLRWDGLDEVKREARARVAAFEVGALLGDPAPKLRVAGWSLAARGDAERWLGRADVEHDDDVCATMHLARAAVRAMPDASELDRRGLRGWAASMATAWAAGAARGVAGERLVAALHQKTLRVPSAWGFGEATAAELTSELLQAIDVEASILEPVVRSLRGEEAPRRILTLSLGPVVQRGRSLVAAQVPPPGLRPDTTSALARVLVERLAELEESGIRDHGVSSAIGIGPGECRAFLAREGVHAPLRPAMPGFEGAPFAWLHRAAVLGGAPRIDALADHLLALPPAEAVELVLSRMPRALLAGQIAAQEKPAEAWARDAALLDAIAPHLREPIAARLSAYVPLGADCPRALGRLVEAAGWSDRPGAAARIADAQRIYVR